MTTQQRVDASATQKGATREKELKSTVVRFPKNLFPLYMSFQTVSGTSYRPRHLRALSVDNSWARFVILVLGNPHLFEGREGGEDGSSNPDRVLSLRRSNNLDGHRLRGKLVKLILQSLVDLLEHGGSSRHDGVGVQVLSDINVALHDRLEGQAVDSLLFNTNERRLEEHFRASESFVSDGNDVSVGKLVVLLQVAGGVGVSHFLLVVEGDEAKLLLDVSVAAPAHPASRRCTSSGPKPFPRASP